MAETNSKARIAVALALIVTVGGYSYHKWAQLHPKGLNNIAGMGAPDKPKSSPPQEGQPDPQQMMANLGLTAEQQKQIEDIRKTNGNDKRAMREATDKVLTTEQRQKMQEQMSTRMEEERSRRDTRLKRTLSDADFEAFKRRTEQMGPPPGGGPPSGDGPPPPGR